MTAARGGGPSPGRFDPVATRCGWRVLVLALAWVSASAAGAVPGAGSQASFASAEGAVAALVAATREGDRARLLDLLGPQSGELISSGDAVADRNARERFVAAYDAEHRITAEGGDRVTLVLGPDGWPFPIPLVREDGRWRFDTAAGRDEILDRHIGRNELSAMEVCRAYVDAQREYGSHDHDGDGLLEYARRFLSRPGRRDGLYWPAGPGGEDESPMGPLVASARAEGYPAGERGKRVPYYGYFYRILTAQGEHAPGGAYDYMAAGHLVGGFALVAFPARHGVSGVMTFLVNQDGIIYERDLGPDTEKIARAMRAFDPGPGWRRH